eukprot:365136-Chlamydomonas_euryale.AAC.2
MQPGQGRWEDGGGGDGLVPPSGMQLCTRAVNNAQQGPVALAARGESYNKGLSKKVALVVRGASPHVQRS